MHEIKGIDRLSEVVIMEDDDYQRESIKSYLVSKGLSVRVAKNVNEIELLHRDRSTRNFILDINMGPGRETEGLAALSKLRKENDDVFVGLLSDSPERYENVVSVLDADIWMKTPSKESDVRSIIEKMVAHAQGEKTESKSEELDEFIANSIDQKEFSWNELNEGLRDFRYPGLINIDGQPLRQDSTKAKTIITDVKNVNEQLIEKLRLQPDLIYQISSRQFEELIAELLSKQGYEVNLTPATRDGGFDLYAAKKETLGKFLYLVECKKYAAQNKVGVDLVRQLYGTLEAKRATAGMIVTTSFFSKGAKEFQDSLKYRVKLHDYIEVQKWMGRIDSAT